MRWIGKKTSLFDLAFGGLLMYAIWFVGAEETIMMASLWAAYNAFVIKNLIGGDA